MRHSLLLISMFISIHSVVFAQATNEDYLPDLISPDELSEEFQLPPAQNLPSDGAFEILNIDDWSSLNGVDLTQVFSIIVVINKSTQGPHAQTAQIFLHGRAYATYPVSTGRERNERSPSGKVYRSTTPVGWFRPRVFSPKHYSHTWKASMPWAVFFNGGIAVHATTRNHYRELGSRASGGCVRLHYDNAYELYHLIKNAGKGSVPRFNQSGKLIRNSSGQIVYENNYKTLIIVENTQD